MREPAVVDHLDRLVGEGRLSGHTVEADTSYLDSARPTLTYRMYAGGATSDGNLGTFCAAMEAIGARLRVTRLVGTVAGRHGVVRTDQRCAFAAFTSERQLERAVELVERRFTLGGEHEVAGSWRFPDIRIGGGTPPGTITAWAHRRGPAVALSLSPDPLLTGAAVTTVRVMERWRDVLTLRHLECSGPDPWAQDRAPWRAPWPPPAPPGGQRCAGPVSERSGRRFRLRTGCPPILG